jgi:preprotein translocase subunit SecG
MTILFLILIILTSVLLGLIVLIQNPKGGGLAGNIAGFSNQFMGVKQTTDVLEKGTWILSGVVVALCMFSILFIGKGGGSDDGLIKGINPGTGTTVPAQQQAPATTPATPAPQTPAPQK